MTFQIGDKAIFKNGESVIVERIRTGRTLTHNLYMQKLAKSVILPDDYIVRFDDGETTIADAIDLEAK